MKLHCWGTRGNVAVPGPDTIEVGGNTSCYQLDMEQAPRLIFDCGSGVIEYASSLGRRDKREAGGPAEHHILISHVHWDHILGFPFFHPIHTPGVKVNLYSALPADELRTHVADLFDGTYSPLRDMTNLNAELTFSQIPAEGVQLGAATVRAQPLDHTGPCYAFRVEAGGRCLCYATDHEARDNDINAAFLDFARGADLLLHDAQYTAEEYSRHVGWGHSSIEACLDNGRLSQSRRLLLTHHDPAYTDDFLFDYVSGLRGAYPDAPPFELAREGRSYEF